jgi:DNA invertase Pin-like site-specific DNA recombinase
MSGAGASSACWSSNLIGSAEAFLTWRSLIGELDANRVALIATSQGIDTSHENPAGRLQMHVLMAVAQFERSLISERTKAGLNAARARGVKFWAGVATPLSPAQIHDCSAEWMAARTSIRDLAAKLGVSVGKAQTAGGGGLTPQ